MSRASNIRIIPEELRNRPSRDLLIMGWDTADIAFSKCLTEAEVYNEIAASKGVTVRRVKPNPIGRPARAHEVSEITVGQSIVIPTRSYRSRGSYMSHLKKKLGDTSHFVVAPEEDGVRVIRVS